VDEVEGVTEIEIWAASREDLAGHLFFKTSGSSGSEKWIALSREALEWSAKSVIEALGIGSDDVLGLALPTIHVGGYGVVVRAEISGARLARFEEKWDADRFALWCECEKVTVSSLVPTQVHDLVQTGRYGPKDLRVIVVGGGALDENLKEQARQQGWPVVPSYGMTETSSQVATGDGLPLLPGWEAKLVDGRLALRGGGLLTAIIVKKGDSFYAEDPKVDGWYLTSDRVELRNSGLTFLGRADRVVKVLGELVDLEEIERFWKKRLGEEVVVLALEDERRGSVLHLYHEGPPVNLTKWNNQRSGPERLADWKAMEPLPRSPLGKIDRAALFKIQQDKDCNHSGN
jgi:O-succinylbenzoic acid--CoA ligase